jgi:hypothetical protein
MWQFFKVNIWQNILVGGFEELFSHKKKGSLPKK